MADEPKFTEKVVKPPEGTVSREEFDSVLGGVRELQAEGMISTTWEYTPVTLTVEFEDAPPLPEIYPDRPHGQFTEEEREFYTRVWDEWLARQMGVVNTSTVVVEPTGQITITATNEEVTE
jgi:hypothetical protein